MPDRSNAEFGGSARASWLRVESYVPSTTSSGELSGWVKRTDRDELVVRRHPDGVLSQRDDRTGLPRRREELDLEPAARVDVHDGPHITAPQPMLRNVDGKNDLLEKLRSH